MRRIVVLALLLLAGCGGPRREVRAATLRGSSELACPVSSLRADWIGGGGVVVSGCGLRQSYTCIESTCAPDGRATGTHVAPSSDEAAEASSAPDRENALQLMSACAMPPGSRVAFYVGVDGDVLRVDDAGPDPTCANAALEAAQFSARSDAELVVVVVPTTEIIPPPAPVLAQDVEASAREAINAVRESILLCNGGQPTTVIGAWTAEGVLTIRLPDARAGTPEDGCIRGVATDARVHPTPGTPGEILHAVR